MGESLQRNATLATQCEETIAELQAELQAAEESGELGTNQLNIKNPFGCKAGCDETVVFYSQQNEVVVYVNLENAVYLLNDKGAVLFRITPTEV